MSLLLRARASPYRRVRTAVWRSLRGKSGFLFAGLMLSNAVAYAYQMVMSRMLSPADYGVLVTLTSISYVLAVLMRTVQAWVIKAVAATGDAGGRRARAAFRVAMRTLVPLGMAALALHWLASGWVADFLQMDAATPVVVLGLYTLSSLVVPVPRGLLLGLDRLYLASVVHVLEPAVRLIAAVALVVWGLGVNGALAGYAAGNLAAFAVALATLWPLLARRDNPELGGDDVGGLDRYALLVLAVNVCLMVIASIDQVVVKHYFSDEVAGNYAVAFLLGRIIALSTMALGWVIFTRSAIAPLDDPRRARLLLKGLVVIGAISLTLTAAYLIAPVLAVRLMGGSRYAIADAYVGLVGIEMTLFSFVYVQAYYQISVRKMQVVWPLCLGALLEAALLARYHQTVEQILLCLIAVMAGLLVCVSGLSWWILRPGRRPETITGSPPSRRAVSAG